jgi:hypothetical protein
LDNGSLKHELTKATIAAIAMHGFYLTHAAIHGLPVAAAHVQGTESTERLETG